MVEGKAKVVLNGEPAGIAKSGGTMDIANMLAEMRLEHERLGEAILAFERLAAGGTKRRGRPPAWLAKLKDPATEKRRPGRPRGSGNRNAEA